MIGAALLLAAIFSRPLERVSTMDGAMARSVYDAQAIQLVCDSPLAIDYIARPYALVPGYCELPTVSADGRVYVFKMRKGPAADMVRSLERLRDPKLVSPNGWILKDVETIRAVDDSTVEIRLARKVRYFPWLMAQTACAVRSADGSGTADYRLSSWRKDYEMVFTRKVPLADGFDTVRYLVIGDKSTQWLMFLKGELDLLGEIPRGNWDAVVDADGALSPSLAAKGIRLHSMPTLEVLYVGMNMKDPVLGPNRKLRQALNAAFDAVRWESFSHHQVVRADGPVPPGIAERLETPFAYAYDVEKARRLMAEAGYPEGIDPKTGRRLVLRMAVGRPDSESREASELMAAFYEKIGVKLESDFMIWNAFLKAVSDGRVQLFRMDWVGDYPDAQNFLQLFYSKNMNPGVNHANYSNAVYDVAFEREDFRQCQEIIREDCPWVFMHYNKSRVLVGPRVGNYVPSDFPYGNERYFRVNGEQEK